MSLHGLVLLVALAGRQQVEALGASFLDAGGIQDTRLSASRSAAAERRSSPEGALSPDDQPANASLVDSSAHVDEDRRPASDSAKQSGGILIASLHNFAFTKRAEVDPLGIAKPDALALTFSLLGGMCMGAYPVPIKAPSVLKAKVHPVIFQTYKSFWVFVMGLGFLAHNWFRGTENVFNFTWLGVLSAAFWIPAGLCCITAVPRLGMGLTMTLLAGTAATMSFLVFWLVLGESMKVHHVGVHPFYTAPLYLCGVVFFMAMLVVVPTLGKKSEPSGKAAEKVAKEQSRAVESEEADTPQFNTALDRLIGFAAALTAGTCCTIQFGTVNVAKRYVLGQCTDTPHVCPPYVVERFDIFGSWMASFGFGALGLSLLAVLGVWTFQAAKGVPLASFQWKVMFLPGNTAGILWAAGNVFQLAALTRGGSAVMMPFNQGCSLMLTGLWGLLYYREVEGLLRSLLWFAVAGCLVIMIVLLSHEKES